MEITTYLSSNGFIVGEEMVGDAIQPRITWPSAPLL